MSMAQCEAYVALLVETPNGKDTLEVRCSLATWAEEHDGEHITVIHADDDHWTVRWATKGTHPVGSGESER